MIYRGTVERPSNSPVSVEASGEPLKSVGESGGPQVAIDMRQAWWTWGIGRWLIPRFSQMRRDNDRLQGTRGRRSEKRNKDEMPIIFQEKREIKVIDGRKRMSRREKVRSCSKTVLRCCPY